MSRASSSRGERWWALSLLDGLASLLWQRGVRRGGVFARHPLSFTSSSSRLLSFSLPHRVRRLVFCRPRSSTVVGWVGSRTCRRRSGALVVSELGWFLLFHIQASSERLCVRSYSVPDASVRQSSLADTSPAFALSLHRLVSLSLRPVRLSFPQ